jgi:SOS response regulatory protein OraA/RecX
VRIESVRTEASGRSTIVVSGGFVFSIPARRSSELPSAADDRAAAGEFGEEDSLFLLLKRIDEEERALSKAAELCAHAEQYSRGLELKLLSRGFSRSSIAYALDRLEAEAILDDARYAAAWARTRLRRKPMGPLALGAELRAKGLGSDDVRNALNSLAFDEILPLAAEAAIAKGVRSRDDLKAVLRRQGFGYEELSNFLDEAFGALE